LTIIDMTGIEAKGTMVTVMSSVWQRADKTMAVSALEHLIRGLFIARLAMCCYPSLSLILVILQVFVRACLRIQTQQLLAGRSHRFILFFFLLTL
jgi:hypothetical protein